MAPVSPLAGLKVVEFAGLGPIAFTAMMLTDMGAEVTRIERPGPPDVQLPRPELDVLSSVRADRVRLDLHGESARAKAWRIVATSDILLESFRPGVMERLGFGPRDCAAINPGLVYVRLSGWGQEGPLAPLAGHDINYLAQSGALHPLGPVDGPPLPPINYVADFGGGGMLALVGALAALRERDRTGAGQIVDAAMVDGASLQTSLLHGWRAMGMWSDERGDNLLDGSAYFYRCYTAADGGFVAVGALEPKFHDAFIAGLGFDAVEFHPQFDRAHWPEREARIAGVFATRTRAHWEAMFAGTDGCVTPVLSLDESRTHPANVARHAHVSVGLVQRPAPAPRFNPLSKES